MSGELALLSSATKALDEVSSAKDAWELARTAEAARKYAQMRNLGTEAVNYATAIKAKALILLADFVDAGQADGTIRTVGRPKNVGDTHNLSEVLGTDSQKARDTVREARRTREALRGHDVDELVNEANETGEDLGLAGLRQRAAAKHEPEPMETPSFPESTYQAIVIDPPWPMPKIQRTERPDQGKTLAYPTMQLDELAALPIKDLAAPSGCHLYLWTTHRFLPDALELVTEWGFRYQCVMTWRKNVGITPFSWMYDTEHVLFGRVGNLDLLRNGLRLSFEAPVQGHSVKPDVFYERVREASPGPRLDMFPGVEHEGFEPWGLEASHRAS